MVRAHAHRDADAIVEAYASDAVMDDLTSSSPTTRQSHPCSIARAGARAVQTKPVGPMWYLKGREAVTCLDWVTYRAAKEQLDPHFGLHRRIRTRVSRQYHENAAEILTELLARGTQLEHLGRRARAAADHARSHVPILIALFPLPVKVSRQARSGSSGPLSLRGGLAMEEQGPASSPRSAASPGVLRSQ